MFRTRGGQISPHGAPTADEQRTHPPSGGLYFPPGARPGPARPGCQARLTLGIEAADERGDRSHTMIVEFPDTHCNGAGDFSRVVVDLLVPPP